MIVTSKRQRRVTGHACGVRKVGSGGVAVFVDESAEAVAPLRVGLGEGENARLAADQSGRREIQ
jgi:hypothetical protein